MQQHPQHVHDVAAAHNGADPRIRDHHEAQPRERAEPHKETSEPRDRREQISLRAYQLWQERGSPDDGSAEEDWYRAEQEIHNGRI